MPKPIHKGVRWSLTQAADEFGIDRGGLKRRLVQSNIEPGQDDKFSTFQVCQAIFGSYDTERTRKITSEANRSELAFQKDMNEVIPMDVMIEFVLGIALALKGKILAAPLPTDVQDKCLGELKGLFTAEEVSKRIADLL